MIIIDQEKCKRDRICAAECPAMLIEFKDKGSYPSAVLNAEERCLKCGHCVAVCPEGALALSDLQPDDCETVIQASLPDAQAVELLLKSRRSIRRFKPDQVERSLLERAIDIARYAPSGHNSQPVHWLVIENASEVQKLAGMVADWMRYIIKNYPVAAAAMHMEDVVAAWDQGKDRICRDAPHLVITYGPSAVGTTAASCSIALTYLELAANSLGLGTCWAGYLGAAAASYPPLVEWLNLPEGYKVYGAMMVGYPRFTYHRIPARNPARIIWR